MADDAANRNPLVFDIETIGDLTPQNRDAVAALAREREWAPAHYAALCPPLARVVCIGWLDVSAQTLGCAFDATLCPGEWPGSIVMDDGRNQEGRSVECTVRGCDGEAQVLRE